MKASMGGALLLLGAFGATTPLAQDQSQTVTGRVVKHGTLEPVESATVTYEEGSAPVQTTVTDERGHFEFARSGDGVVTVSAREFGTARRRWPPVAGDVIDIALVAPAVIYGVVTNEDGEPVPARVMVTVNNPYNLVSKTVLSAAGGFRMGDLPPGSAEVLVVSDGLAPHLRYVMMEAGRETETDVYLMNYAIARGRVLSEAGAPVIGAIVNAHYQHEVGSGGVLENFVGGMRRTGPDGTFELHGLVPNTEIALQAVSGERQSDVEVVQVGPARTQEGIELRIQ